MTSSADENLSQWVSNVQDRHRGTGGIDTAATPETSQSTSSAAELEEEIRRSRAERAKRRSQTVGLVSPLPAGSSDVSGENSSRKRLGERGAKSPLEDSNSINMKTAYAPPSFASASPPKRTNALLERYGGAAGPTGVARPGNNGSPASLANFIGGRASGPRLGKLQGDGRNAPPEAAEYLEARALPGMTNGTTRGGTGLASFLEARASGQNNIRSSSPTKTSSLQSPNHSDTASLSATTQTDVSTGLRQDRATSPLKEGQAVLVKQPHLEAERHIQPESEKPPVSYIAQRSNQPESSPPLSASAVGTSPAFKATQIGSDRMPTASLTRLKSKKMVEQRVREAQERAEADPSPSSSPVLKSTPAWMSQTYDKVEADAASAGLKARWPVVADKQPSPTKELKNVFAFGNALPGMSQTRAAPARNLYASNRREIEEIYSPPVRLPGMGSAQSPFPARSAATESKETLTQPLEQLAKGRAKPKRTARTSTVDETVKDPIVIAESLPEERTSRQDFSAARDAFSQTRRTPSPRKPQLHISMDPATPDRPVRQDSIPDSADKRIADSTAALEALLEGKREATPTLEKSKMIFVPDKIRQSGTLKIARNKDGHISIDTSAIHRYQSAKRLETDSSKDVSIEVAIVRPDGSLQTLQGEEARVLYETEAQIITCRYKNSAAGASISTKVFARTGTRSRLLIDPSCMEAKKVQELGKLHRAVVIDARQGRESIELVKLMGGSLITREGSRSGGGKDSTGMYQVRGSDGAIFVDQVDMLTSSLCSAHSAIIVLQRDIIVWHGIGSSAAFRQKALQYARQMKTTDSQKTITEFEEGKEDDFFWTYLDRSAHYSNAWHHRFMPQLVGSELEPRLFSIQGTGSSKRLFDQTEFSLIDVRRDGIHILQLPLEIYVLIGPDARSRRREIQICIEAASNIAKNVSHRRGPSIMTTPIHVVVFPTIPPRELKSAFRYWHDEHLNGKGWQRAGLGMNVWERQSAMEQLNCHEFPLWQVNDELFLPVGIGLDDVQGIDV